MDVELLAGNIAAHWVQAAALATSALIAMKLLHLNEPRARLAALHATLVAIVLLPLVQPWRSDEAALPARSAANTIEVAAIASAPGVVSAMDAGPWLDPALAIVVIAAVGTTLRFLWLLYGITRLARFSRRATVVATPPTAVALEVEIGVSPRYILQPGDRGPWTFGLSSPTVALPSRFEALTPDFQQAVICHELLHIKRRDTIVVLVEELALAMLWFHPWVWLLRGRLRIAREQVVDARVVELLGNRDGYVRCLVDISGHDLAPYFSPAGAGMLRPRELRARVDAIFQEARMSTRHLVFVTLALMMAVGATTYIAAAALPMRSPAIVDPASAGGDPYASAQATGTNARHGLDPAIAGRPITLRFAAARLRDVLAFLGHTTSVVFTGYEDSFDESGSVTIDATAELEPLLDRLLTPNGLMYSVTGPRTIVIARNPLAEKGALQQSPPPQTAPDAPRKQINTVYPEYPQDALERGIRGTVIVDITVNAAGDVTTVAVASGPEELRASAFKAALGLKFAPGPTTVAMQVSFEYTLTADSWGVRIGDASRTGARASPASAARSPQANGTLTPAVRITGDMRPPKKTRDVPPIYPAAAQQARVQGIVDMEARIDENGSVSDVRILRSIPMLDEAAMQAVKQWQYTPTLMNGAPVPVLLTVTVSFSLRQLIDLHAVLPDGTSTVIGLSGNDPIELRPGPGARFHLRARVSEDGNEATVSVFADDGETHLGDMTLTIRGPVVQTPTNPSVGLQFLGLR